jgi:hypothetical protein
MTIEGELESLCAGNMELISKRYSPDFAAHGPIPEKRSGVIRLT